MEVFAQVPIRVLGIFAHPDDADVACGGTLALWASKGSRITLVVCTQGEKGTLDAGAPEAVLTEERKREVGAASVDLGIEQVIHLGYGDGEIASATDIKQKLVRIVRDTRPEVVIGPDPTAVFFGNHYVNHADHRALGWCVLDVLFPAARLPKYYPEAGPPHTIEYAFLAGTLEPTHIVDVSGTLDTKVKAVSRHRSQVGDDAETLGEILRSRAAEVGSQSGLRYGESFRVISHAPMGE